MTGVSLEGREIMSVTLKDVRTGDLASLRDPRGRLRWMRVIGLFTGTHKHARLWFADGHEAHCVFLTAWGQRRLRVARLPGNDEEALAELSRAEP